MNERIRAVNELIKEHVSEIIYSEISPLNGFLTCLAVETSRDLRQAKIWLSYIGEEAARENVFLELEEKRQLIQNRLNKILCLKHVPRIEFFLDQSGQYAAGLEKKYRELKDRNK